MSIVPLYDTGVEIGRVKKIAGANAPHGKSFVDCPRSRVIHLKDGISWVDIAIPAGDRAVFGGKNEKAGTRYIVLCYDEVAGAVEDIAGGGMVTTSGEPTGKGVPSPLYSVDTPLPLSETHQGVAGPCDRPQELTRFGSWNLAILGRSETRLVCR